ncbi:peptidase S8/S53 domain-containing protein [Xylaria bambusicola]|uniref:peptidase S8/S53 domain-containing protein n=1 Tax=Xylaria bambusicola TaxID=326684 RepID=UPI002007C40E|nr:peptidase S8/S53 domain-containing protein [Xylaria bambusicola]KAI0503375.1 peptidase S8/S53 domain-containing protein [Xylaria bambusicola]
MEITYKSAGEGIFVYCIDTGIATDHPDFEGRAEFGASFVDGEGEGDGNGHGTHSAGTIGSKTWGVAKKTRLIAVKVLGASGSGSTSSVIEGMQWALHDATDKRRIGRSVANLSLGNFNLLGLLGGALNDAAAAMVAGGMFLAVAAGNDGLPASLSSPASEPTVCTVGATDNKDARANFSNWGNLVDVFAPGVDVTSTWNDLGTNTISGTSMAAPHVAGLGAYLLALEGAMDPIALCKRIQKLATPKVVSLALSPNNLLAFNGVSL